MERLDCSTIRTLRVPHQQFEAIKNKAKYLEIVDKDKGDVITFVPEKLIRKIDEIRLLLEES